MLVDAALVDERHRFAEQFDDGCDQEVATELDEICGLRLLRDDEGALPDRFE